jgi:hypothetical protein
MESQTDHRPRRDGCAATYTAKIGVNKRDEADGVALPEWELSKEYLLAYPESVPSSDGIQGVHLLPNGHFLVAITWTSSSPINGNSVPEGTIYFR